MDRGDVSGTRTDLPDARFCDCGYRVKWYTIDPAPDTTSVFYEITEKAGLPHLELHEDIVERDCPHGNGTVIQHCPKCDRNVGMWGMGVAGGMECDCWDAPRPSLWRRLWAIVTGSSLPEDPDF